MNSSVLYTKKTGLCAEQNQSVWKRLLRAVKDAISNTDNTLCLVDKFKLRTNHVKASLVDVGRFHTKAVNHSSSQVKLSDLQNYKTTISSSRSIEQNQSKLLNKLQEFWISNGYIYEDIFNKLS